MSLPQIDVCVVSSNPYQERLRIASVGRLSSLVSICPEGYLNEDI
jgi:hypothetical protein